MNPSPFAVSPNTHVSQVFNLFRTMGLRHLPVVNAVGEVSPYLSFVSVKQGSRFVVFWVFFWFLFFAMLSPLRELRSVLMSLFKTKSRISHMVGQEVFLLDRSLHPVLTCRDSRKNCACFTIVVSLPSTVCRSSQ